MKDKRPESTQRAQASSYQAVAAEATALSTDAGRPARGLDGNRKTVPAETARAQAAHQGFAVDAAAMSTGS